MSLAWLVTGRTVGGLRIYPQRNCLDRETALRLWTENATWFSNEEGRKGRIEAGQLADLIVPDRDYFACPESEIADTVSELTVVGGRIVYAAGVFVSLDTPPPPAMPDWSPARRSVGYVARAPHAQAMACPVHDPGRAPNAAVPVDDSRSFWGALGCSCFAF